MSGIEFELADVAADVVRDAVQRNLQVTIMPHRDRNNQWVCYPAVSDSTQGGLILAHSVTTPTIVPMHPRVVGERGYQQEISQIKELLLTMLAESDLSETVVRVRLLVTPLMQTERGYQLWWSAVGYRDARTTVD